MKITAAMVKELRGITGAGMLDCKKALEANDGDIQKSVDFLREKGLASAAKKADRIAAEGLTSVVIKNNDALLFELNSETDFVAKNDKFLALIDSIGAQIAASKATNTEEALLVTDKEGNTIEKQLLVATSTIGEKLSLRRVQRVTKTDSQGFGYYKHMGGRISVLTITEKEDADVAKDISMHVCVYNPKFKDRASVDQATIEHEKHILSEQMANDPSLADKPEKMLAGILQGKLNKVLQDFVLLEQGFVKDQTIKVADYLKSHNNSVVSYVRLEVGEGIEKNEVDFADEVMAQVKK